MRQKTRMRSNLEGLGGLSGPELKHKLLERMANSEGGQKRFWKRVLKRSVNECWPWTGGKLTTGYGKIALSFKGKVYRFFVNGEHPVQIAKIFGVCKMTVWNIIHGKNGSHLPFPEKIQKLIS